MSISGAALTVERKWWKMISDKERRDVAARMREICHENPDVSLQGMVASTMNECLPEGMEYGPTLAELIDRPMCHDLVKHKQDPFIPGKQMADGYFHCSSCDWSGQLLEYIGFGGMLAYEPVHCPKCGEEIER